MLGFLPLDFPQLALHALVMFWHVLLLRLSPLDAPIGCLTVDDRDREILALRQQVLILQRQLGKRPRLVRAERLVLLLSCLRMKEQQLIDCLMVVRAVRF